MSQHFKRKFIFLLRVSHRLPDDRSRQSISGASRERRPPDACHTTHARPNRQAFSGDVSMLVKPWRSHSCGTRSCTLMRYWEVTKKAPWTNQNLQAMVDHQSMMRVAGRCRIVQPVHGFSQTWRLATYVAFSTHFWRKVTSVLRTLSTGMGCESIVPCHTWASFSNFLYWATSNIEWP